MNLELIFSIANTTAFLCWIFLFVLYHKRWVYRLLFSYVFTFLAIGYLFFILKGIGTNSGGGFDSLANVKLLFSQDEAILAGWIHYLIFDLFSVKFKKVTRNYKVYQMVFLVQVTVFLSQ